MATVRNRKTAKNTRGGSNAMGIQKQINTDYEYLLRDYGKLGVELWRKPLTKYILGGFALGAIASLLSKNVDFDNVSDFTRDKLQLIKNKFDQSVDTIE